MPSLRASGQGSGAPAHLQVVQRPTGQNIRELLHALVSDSRADRKLSQVGELATLLEERHEGGKAVISDLVSSEVEHSQFVQRPALNCLSESREACVANVVVIEPKNLRMAHQTKGMR